MTEFWYNQSADLTLSTPSLGVDSFLEGSFTKQIHITAAVPVAYLLVVEQADVVLDVFVEHPGASLQLYAICFSATPEAKTIRVVTHMQGSQTHAQVHLLSFLYDHTALQVHGDMLIAPSTQGVQAHLLQENIVFGDEIHIQAVPMLSVASHDVQASHGAKVERLDAAKLMYMTSRGLSPTQAQALVVQGYLHHMYDQMLAHLGYQDDDAFHTFLEQLQDRIIL